MGALDTLLEIAEGTVEVLDVVSCRAARINQIRTADGAVPPAEPSRYSRARAHATRNATATTGAAASHADRTSNDTAAPTVVSPAEPSVESVIDAQTQRTVWIVKHGANRVECSSEEIAEKIKHALR